jgi:hypothetical protein
MYSFPSPAPCFPCACYSVVASLDHPPDSYRVWNATACLEALHKGAEQPPPTTRGMNVCTAYSRRGAALLLQRARRRADIEPRAAHRAFLSSGRSAHYRQLVNKVRLGADLAG